MTSAGGMYLAPGSRNGGAQVDHWEFYRHMPVYLANGRKLGRTLEVGHAVDYIHVQQGRLLVVDWYIPISAVREVNQDGVYLNVNQDALRSNRWNVPSAEYLAHQGTTPGYEYTSRSDIPAYAPAGDAAAPS